MIAPVDLQTPANQGTADTLSGPGFTLRALRQSDYEMLYSVETSAELGWRWRHRGGTPSPDRFVQTLWDGVFVQYLVVDPASAAPLGLVSAYNPDFVNGHASVAMAAFAPEHSGLTMLAAMEVFLDHVFACFDLRKLYAEIAEFNFGGFAGGVGRIFVDEGCLLDHQFAQGRHWDVHILAIHRNLWRDRRFHAGTLAAGPASAGPTSHGNELDDFELFAAFLVERLGLAVERLAPGDVLAEHLDVDSLGVLLIVVAIEEELGVTLPEDLPWNLWTAGDLHAAYRAHR